VIIVCSTDRGPQARVLPASQRCCSPNALKESSCMDAAQHAAHSDTANNTLCRLTETGVLRLEALEYANSPSQRHANTPSQQHAMCPTPIANKQTSLLKVGPRCVTHRPLDRHAPWSNPCSAFPPCDPRACSCHMPHQAQQGSCLHNTPNSRHIHGRVLSDCAVVMVRKCKDVHWQVVSR
jgi:hypothetical protein